MKEPDKLNYATPDANRNAAQPPDRPIVGSLGCAVYSLLTAITALVLLLTCGARNWSLRQLGLLLSLIFLFAWRAFAAASAAGMYKPKPKSDYNFQVIDDETGEPYNDSK